MLECCRPLIQCNCILLGKWPCEDKDIRRMAHNNGSSDFSDMCIHIDRSNMHYI